MEPATDGRAALKYLREKTYQLILMDVQMPGMSGLEVTRLVRDKSKPGVNHRVPIVAITASAFLKRPGKMLDLGYE